jgi:very-short-patch-repair endonuclease
LAQSQAIRILRHVPRTPNVPRELKRGPFSLDEARAAGLTLSSLKGKAWKRIDAQLYQWSAQSEHTMLTLSAWHRLLPPGIVFAGGTAAWLFGLDVEPTKPVEIAAPPNAGLRSRAGLIVGRYEIPPTEVVSIRGFCATALPRTLARICVGLPAVDALVAIDMAVHLRLTNSAALTQYAEAAKGRPGAGRLRSLALLAAPAESPMETRLRWLLIQARLPRPEVQTNLQVSTSQQVVRADLYYPTKRLILEYDGGNHRERLVEDDRRQNLLISAGFRLLRFTASDIYRQPEVVVSQVRAALSAG